MFLQHIKICLLLTALFSIGCAPHRAPSLDPVDAGLRAKLTGIIEQHAQKESGTLGDVPGVQLAVVQNGKLKHHLAAGWSNPNPRSEDCPVCPLPMRPEMFVEFGSMSKTFTAGLVLQFAGGKSAFELDQDLDKWLPAFARDPQINNKATMAQLLNMTSGIDNFSDRIRYSGQIIQDMDDSFLGLFEHTPHVHGTKDRLVEARSPQRFWMPRNTLDHLEDPVGEPGEKFTYSNTNYVLLGMVLQELTNFWDISEGMRENLFEPYDIKRIYMGGYDRVPFFKMSTGWSRKGRRMLASENRTAFYTAYWTSGGLVGDLGSAAKWIWNLYSPDVEVLRPEILEKMCEMRDLEDQIKPQCGKTIDGIVLNGYGLGTMRIEVDLGENRKATMYGHSGITGAFVSSGFYLPERDASILLVVNRKSKESLSALFEMLRDVTRTLMEEPAPAA